MSETILFNHGGAIWVRFANGSLLPLHQWDQAQKLLEAKRPTIGDVDDEMFGILVNGDPAGGQLALTQAHTTAGVPAG